jgi:hypothetical protein
MFRLNTHERRQLKRVPHSPLKRLGRVFYRTAPGRFWDEQKVGKTDTAGAVCRGGCDVALPDVLLANVPVI